MTDEQHAADVIFNELEYALRQLEAGNVESTLKTLHRMRATVAAHALKNTGADVGSVHWHNIVNVLRAAFPQEDSDE